MNERIQELARQADAYAWQQIDEGADYDEQPRYFAEKFAKLIVRECISAVENLSPGYQDYRNQIEDAFRRDCVEQIKQHFGVEE